MTAHPVLVDAGLYRWNEEARAAVHAGKAVPQLVDAWRCSECGRKFPTAASTERHVEFEHPCP